MKNDCKPIKLIVSQKGTKEKGGNKVKIFYSGIFMNQEQLKEEGKQYPIKIEYYKKINEDEFLKKENAIYGIQVIKTEYIPEKTKTEEKDIPYLTNDEEKVEKVLQILKNNEVTPICVEEIISDIRNQMF